MIRGQTKTVTEDVLRWHKVSNDEDCWWDEHAQLMLGNTVLE